MLIIGRKYRVKTHEELIESGWRWREADEYYTHRDANDHIVGDMLSYTHVTFEDTVDGEWGSVREDNGEFSWCEQMLVLVEPIKRNLPAWF